MASEGDAKIRRIAIVLQSTDAETVRKLLAQFPDDAARAIRRTMANLGTVSPAERASAAKELRNLFGKPSEPDASDNPALQVLDQGKEIQDAVQWSPEARSGNNTVSGSTPPHQGSHSHPFSNRWQNIPPETLAQVLQHERPTVVAAIVHELPVVMATAVLQLLPIPTATQTMAAMPHLHRNDPSILNELMEQIRDKVEELVRIEHKSQQGLEKLKAIVAQAPEDQRYLWATSLGNIDPQLPFALGWNRSTSATPSPATPSPATSSQGAHPPGTHPPFILPFPTPSPSSPVAATNNEHSKIAATRTDTSSQRVKKAQAKQLDRSFRSFRDIMELDDVDFVAVLHAVEPEKVLLALAGVESSVIKRVERLLPRKELPRFRERLHSLSEVSLNRIDEACAAICDVANHLHAEGRVGRASTIPFSAAA
jgi:flagellar motor switch protein FliG